MAFVNGEYTRFGVIPGVACKYSTTDSTFDRSVSDQRTDYTEIERQTQTQKLRDSTSYMSSITDFALFRNPLHLQIALQIHEDKESSQ